jgi:hypothetical protein
MKMSYAPVTQQQNFRFKYLVSYYQIGLWKQWDIKVKYRKTINGIEYDKQDHHGNLMYVFGMYKCIYLQKTTNNQTNMPWKCE